MTSNQGKRQLRSGGSAWGPARVRAGVSIRELERLSGVHRSILSMAENGRLVPSGAEWDAVMRALGPSAQTESASAGETETVGSAPP